VINELEALLFLTPRPLRVDEIARHLGVREEEIPPLIEELKKRYEGTALTVEEFLGSYRLNVREEYHHLARKLGLIPEFNKRELQIIGRILKEGEVKLSELRKSYRGMDRLLEKLRRFGFVVLVKRGRSKFVKKTKLMERYFGITQGSE